MLYKYISGILQSWKQKERFLKYFPVNFILYFCQIITQDKKKRFEMVN